MGKYFGMQAMNWEAVGAGAEVLGVITVIVTVVYLALQVRHATSVAKSVARQTAAQMNIETIGASLDSQILSVASRKATNGEELTPEELSNYIRWIWMRMRVVENAYFQFQEGLLDSEAWTAHTSYIVNHIGQGTVGQQHWARVTPAYSTSFVTEVERILKAYALAPPVQ